MFTTNVDLDHTGLLFIGHLLVDDGLKKLLTCTIIVQLFVKTDYMYNYCSIICQN